MQSLGAAKPVLLLTDSQNARAQTLNKFCTARTRHLDLRYKWIISKTTDEGAFDLQYVQTNYMPADGLTKALGRTLHESFMRQMNVVKVPRGEAVSC